MQYPVVETAQAEPARPIDFRPTIPVFLVHQILLGARRLALPLEPVLRRAGISGALLDSPHARVTQTQCANLMRILRRVLRDEFWGLLGRPVRPGVYAQACRAMVREATLGQAMRAGLEHYRLHIDDFVPRLQLSGEVASLRLFVRAPLSEPLAFAQSTFIYQAFGISSWLTGQTLPLRGVDFMRPPVLGMGEELQRMFDAPAHALQQHTALHFDARLLALPVVRDNAGLATFLSQAPGNLVLRYREDNSLGEQVRNQLRMRLRSVGDADATSLETVAEALGMPAATLRRRLWEEDSSFQAIKDTIRRDVAIRDLETSALSVQEIAERLGFSEPSAFHRAFKKWTGVAPGEYRRRHRASDGD